MINQKFFEFVTLFDRTKLNTRAGADKKRHYVTPEGKSYKSVTTILGEQVKPALEAWKKRVGPEEVNKAKRKGVSAANRGTALHSLVERYMGNELIDPKQVLPSTLAMFADIKGIIDDNIDQVYGQEFSLYSDVLQTAGTCDAFVRFDGYPTVLDFKTSSKVKKEQYIGDYFLQCTVYALMLQERYNINVPRIAVLIGVEGEDPQLFVRKPSEFYSKVQQVFITDRAHERV